MISLICPTCKEYLEYPSADGEMNCPACGHLYQNREGVIDFIPKNNFYWGEIEEDLMRRVNDQALIKGWFRSMVDNIPQKPKLLNYLLDPVRIAGIYHCYDPGMNETCLDLGSGWGPISVGLSRFYKFVYSVDGVYERLRFQAIRAHQEGFSNITLLRGDLLELPIPDRSVDLVVINGLLEWIGLSQREIDPKYMQEIFLKEVYRVLKDGGKVFIGIENRFGLQYFAGGKDHSGLRFTSIMPRWMSDIVMARFQRVKHPFILRESEASYRTLTYSYWGYKHLLDNAGFILPEIYWTWPGYNYPRASGKLDGRSVKYYLGQVCGLDHRRLFRILFRFLITLPVNVLGGLIKFFSPYFLIVASKSQNNATIQEKILGYSNNASSFLRLTLGTRFDFKTTYILLNTYGVAKIINASESSQAGRMSSFDITDVKKVNGASISPYNLRQIGLAANWLVDFQVRTRLGIWNSAQVEDEIVGLCNQVRQFITEKDLAVILETFQRRYSSFIKTIKIPIVMEHGDFTPTNIFITDNGIEPIDWEFQRKCGNPLMDPGGFILSLLLTVYKSGVVDENNQFGKRIGEFTHPIISKLSLPLHFAPVYYLLRKISRYAADSITPLQNVQIHEWLKYLPICLEFFLEHEPKNNG